MALVVFLANRSCVVVDRTFLADLNGDLCVVWESSDSLTPFLVRHYWPVQSSPGSVCRTRDFLARFEADASRLGEMPVRRSMPGEYLVQVSSDAFLGRNCYLTLIEGAKTRSVQVERVPFPAPRSSLETKYEDGSWWVRLNGRWKIRA